MKAPAEAIAAGATKKAFAYKEGVLRIHVEKMTGATGAEAKSFYYLIKLHHLLFPDVFPDTHGAGLDEGGRVNFLVEEVAHDDMHKKYQALQMSDAPNNDRRWHELVEGWKSREASPEFREIVEKVKAAGLAGEFQPHNSSRDSDGKLKFFDFGPGFWADGNKIELGFNPTLLRNAIRNIKDAKSREWAIYCYNKIRELLPKDFFDNDEQLQESFVAI